MNINAGSYFSDLPEAKIERSVWQMPSGNMTTFDAGKLVPFYVSEVLPGDTWKMHDSFVVRTMTPIVPVMDNSILDIYYFFVPNRLVWDHWVNFMGQNDTSPWVQKIEYSVPQTYFPAGDGWHIGTVADYMGIPTGVGSPTGNKIGVSSLPFRAYVKIWNDWFRDQNVMDPAYLQTGDDDVEGSNFSDVYPLHTAVKGGSLLPVSKTHDYFTSALPSPQKGEPIAIPLTGSVPIVTGADHLDNLGNVSTNIYGAGVPTSQGYGVSLMALQMEGYGHPDYIEGLGTGALRDDTNGEPASHLGGFNFSNLWADMSDVGAVTINALRTAFQLQRLLEKDARGGSRYIELLQSHFGVVSPDGRLQRSELLGARRVPINVDQVLQSASAKNPASETLDPIGTTGAYSITSSVDSTFTKSFTEHGFIIGVMCARVANHKYQYGLEKFWNRRDRFDYYWPSLAHIGEQPILNSEIYFDPNSEDFDGVFGYQEAWADYRYKPSKVTGHFRSSSSQSLDYWHYGDRYNSIPVLSEDFISETPAGIGRSLYYYEPGVNQMFFADMQFNPTVARPMPLYSVPGLIDHF